MTTCLARSRFSRSESLDELDELAPVLSAGVVWAMVLVFWLDSALVSLALVEFALWLALESADVEVEFALFMVLAEFALELELVLELALLAAPPLLDFH